MTHPATRRRVGQRGGCDDVSLSPPEPLPDREWVTDVDKPTCRFGHNIRYIMNMDVKAAKRAREAHLYVPCHTCHTEYGVRSYQYGYLFDNGRQVEWYGLPSEAGYLNLLRLGHEAQIAAIINPDAPELTRDRIVMIVRAQWNLPNGSV